MSLGGSLRAELTKYLKRKQLSLDGTVAGAEPTEYRRSVHPATPHRFEHLTRAHPAPSHFEAYDPVHAAYEWDSPEYRSPDSWFEGMTHATLPPERIAPGWPPPPTVPQDSVQYRDSLMTPELFHRMLQEISMVGSLPIEAEMAQREVVHSTDEANAKEAESGQSMWAPRELRGEHPWFGASQAAPDPYEIMMVQATEQHEPVSEMALQEAAMQDMCDQPPQQSLEATIEGQMSLQIQEDPFEIERRMYDHQIQQLDQMLNPFAAPGFGPGP